VTAVEAPLITVVTLVFDPPVFALREAIASVRRQKFEQWELILVDDFSASSQVRDVLREAARADRRIRVIERASNGGIVAASNDALAAAQGEFLALLDHDDFLSFDALETIAPVLGQFDDVDYVYSDEDKVAEDGAHYESFHKPEWSPERLRYQMYTGHLSVLRTSLVREVGGFRPGFDGSQDHDLVLRLTERARRIVHVPKVLYHWRVVPGSTAGTTVAKPYAQEAGRRAIAEHLSRVGIDGEVLPGPIAGIYRIRRNFHPGTSVSVVIPTRGGSGMVWGEHRCFVVECVASIMRHTAIEDLEIVVVYDTATPALVLDQLRSIAGSCLTLVPFDEDFNFSAKCNVGFLHARGDVVVMLNDDIELVTDGSIEQLVAPLRQGDVGMVGARLLFANGRLQHGGQIFFDGGWNHARFGAGSDDLGPFGALVVGREASGLTAACVAIRRETYEQVGGMCEALPVNFNDVDLSYKVRAAGFRLVWTPEVTLYHFESQTREPVVLAWEADLVRRRWGVPQVDPYFPQ
jgi:GT2 family glycosyltransferase